MQTFESEGPSAHTSLTHLGKLSQVWVYIRRNPKQNTEIPLEYPNVKNKLSNK